MDKGLSFSKQVKEEITENTFDSDLKIKALLSAFIRINGSVIFSNKETHLLLNTEDAKTAKFIYGLLNKYYSNDVHLDFSKKSKNAKKNVYKVIIDSNADQIIEELKIDFLDDKVSRDIAYNDQTISGYLAGAFLACGSVNSPLTSDYHLELRLNSENSAKWLAKLFNRFRGYQLEPKLGQRRDKYLVYFKRSDQISNFLVMIGAVNSCMEFENVRIDRDFVNSTVRLANFDTANMSRTVNSGKRQKDEINYIKEHLGMNHFKNPKCLVLAELRLENESFSYDDLASLMSQKLNQTITKSNVNHLFRQIHELYETIKVKQ